MIRHHHVYSPSGQSEISRRSRHICHSIKQDGPSGDPTRRMIEFAVARLLEEEPAQLGDFLWPDATLVPVPRSAPFPPQATNVLWVPNRICWALLDVGYGAAVAPLLERIRPVGKSAYAPRGQRPGVQEHIESMRVMPSVVPLERVVLVDDVVTRGATLIATAHLIRQAHPRAEVRAFALLRTRGLVPEIERIVDAVIGRILHRPLGRSAPRTLAAVVHPSRGRMRGMTLFPRRATTAANRAPGSPRLPNS